jgi:hypothetical protein
MKIKKVRLSDTDAIQKALSEAYGRMENQYTPDDISRIAGKVCQPWATKKLLKGAVITHTASEALPKAYGYRKDVPAFRLGHDGKDFFFLGAFRATCWAGGSVGGTRAQFPAQAREEIVNKMLDRAGVTFFAQARDALAS